jgi:hypothetical protein
MILRQFLHMGPVGISYLFGCGGKAAGAVVDPIGDIQFYLRAAEEAGMRIRFVIDTHIHADHASAGRRLAEASDAPYVLGASAHASFPFQAAQDGEVLSPSADPSAGADSAANRLSTIGFERRHNRAFAMDDEEEFVGYMLRDVPRSPVDAARIRAVNAGLDAAM